MLYPYAKHCTSTKVVWQKILQESSPLLCPASTPPDTSTAASTAAEDGSHFGVAGLGEITGHADKAIEIGFSRL